MPSSSAIGGNESFMVNFFGALQETDDREEFRKEVGNLDKQ